MANYRIGIGNTLLDEISAQEAVVVIDNLRASSTIVTALALGVEKIMPVLDDEEAFALRNNGAVIAGESGGEKIEGYDLGNSPVELVEFYNTSPFTTLVLKTSNLIPLLSRLPEALICSSLNLASIAAYLENKNVCILAVGGHKGATEDLGVAFALQACMSRTIFDTSLITCFARESQAAQHLINIGYGKDIDFITRVNIFNVIPHFDGKKIVTIAP